MKLLSPRIILAVFALISLFACQKEIESTGTEEPVPTDKPFLKTYIILDTTQPGQVDTVVAADISYDVNGRVDSIFYRNFYEGDFDYATLETRFYNGGDTLVAKRLSQWTTDFINVYSVVEFFEYDAKQRMIYDSIAELFDPPYFLDVYSCRYESDEKFHILERAGGLPDTASYSLVMQVRSGNNIVSEINDRYPGYGGQDTSYFTHAVSFDTHPNPLSGIDIKWPALFVAEHVYDELFDWEFHQQTNNYISYISNGFQAMYNVQYTYNADGYPVFSRYNTDDLYGGSGMSSLKVIYGYY